MDINTIDWREAWAEYQHVRRAADKADYWNARARSFSLKAGTSPYAHEFIERAAIKEGESVLDMGCGSGTLAIPLALAGHEVYACDFSHAMLSILEEAAEANGVADKIHTKLVSWTDDWDALGVPVCDVALASRSMAAIDLWDAIEKLDSRARRRVCVTMGTDQSPRIDEVLREAVGRPKPGLSEFVYTMNILWVMGKLPELSHIYSGRQDTFETIEDAVAKHAKVLEANADETALLRAYAAEHMHQVETEDGLRWRFDHERVTSWAFISWSKGDCC